MWQNRGGVFKERVGHPHHELPPVNRDPEKLALRRVGAQVSEEQQHLTDALFDEEVSESEAAVERGSEDHFVSRVSIKARFHQARAGGRRLDLS